MPYKLSPSSLSLYKECPRCFWLQFRKGIRRPAMVFPSLPSGMDRILKAHFDSYRGKGKKPPELADIAGVVLFDDADSLAVWRNNQKGIRWEDENRNVLKGAVDDLLLKGKRVIVIDFKTRGFAVKEDTAAHYQDQLDIYNFLLRKNGYETEDYAYLLFYHPQSVDDRGRVLFNKTLVKMKVLPWKAERLFREALKTLSGRIPKSSKECEFCRWGKEKG